MVIYYFVFVEALQGESIYPMMKTALDVELQQSEEKKEYHYRLSLNTF